MNMCFLHMILVVCTFYVILYISNKEGTRILPSETQQSVAVNSSNRREYLNL